VLGLMEASAPPRGSGGRPEPVRIGCPIDGASASRAALALDLPENLRALIKRAAESPAE